MLAKESLDQLLQLLRASAEQKRSSSHEVQLVLDEIEAATRTEKVGWPLHLEEAAEKIGKSAIATFLLGVGDIASIPGLIFILGGQLGKLRSESVLLGLQLELRTLPLALMGAGLVGSSLVLKKIATFLRRWEYWQLHRDDITQKLHVAARKDANTILYRELQQGDREFVFDLNQKNTQVDMLLTSPPSRDGAKPTKIRLRVQYLEKQGWCVCNRDTNEGVRIDELLPNLELQPVIGREESDGSNELATNPMLESILGKWSPNLQVGLHRFVGIENHQFLAIQAAGSGTIAATASTRENFLPDDLIPTIYSLRNSRDGSLQLTWGADEKMPKRSYPTPRQDRFWFEIPESEESRFSVSLGRNSFFLDKNRITILNTGESTPFPVDELDTVMLWFADGAFHFSKTDSPGCVFVGVLRRGFVFDEVSRAKSSVLGFEFKPLQLRDELQYALGERVFRPTFNQFELQASKGATVVSKNALSEGVGIYVASGLQYNFGSYQVGCQFRCIGDDCDVQLTELQQTIHLKPNQGVGLSYFKNLLVKTGKFTDQSSELLHLFWTGTELLVQKASHSYGNSVFLAPTAVMDRMRQESFERQKKEDAWRKTYKDIARSTQRDWRDEAQGSAAREAAWYLYLINSEARNDCKEIDAIIAGFSSPKPSGKQLSGLADLPSQNRIAFEWRVMSLRRPLHVYGSTAVLYEYEAPKTRVNPQTKQHEQIRTNEVRTLSEAEKVGLLNVLNATKDYLAALQAELVELEVNQKKHGSLDTLSAKRLTTLSEWLSPKNRRSLSVGALKKDWYKHMSLKFHPDVAENVTNHEAFMIVVVLNSVYCSFDPLLHCSINQKIANLTAPISQ